MEFLTLVVYCLLLIGCVLASGILAIQANKPRDQITAVFATPHKPRLVSVSFWFLFWYFLLNLAIEITAWFHLPQDLNNNYVYSAGYLLTTAMLFVFFGIHSGNKIYTGTLVIIYAFLLCLYFYFGLWHTRSITPFLFGICLFSSIAVVSVIFLAFSLVTHTTHPNRFKIRLAIHFLIYSFAALFISVFSFNHSVEALPPTNMFYLNVGIASLFYATTAWLLFKLLRSLNNLAALKKR